jgi:chitodextrinase
VVVDAQGEAIAVWTHFEAAEERSVVEVAARPAGGEWQVPTRLSLAGQNAFSPEIGIDPEGEAVAVWRQSTGESAQFAEAAVRPAGGAWQQPVQLSPNPDALDVSVAVGSQGDAVAVWDTGHTVWSSMRMAGGAWQSPVDLSPPEDAALVPQVALDPQGEAVVVWEGEGLFGVVQSVAGMVGGAWGPPVTLSGRGATAPHVGVDAAGEAIAVWDLATDTSGVVQGASRPVGGSWEAPVQLSTLGETAAYSQVTVDAQGDASAIWYDETAGPSMSGEGYVVQSASRAAGAAWQTPVALSGPGGGQGGPVLGGNPEIAVNPRGDLVAVWSQSNGSDYSVRGAVRKADGPWQEASSLSSVDQDAGYPQLAVDPRGNAVAVWESSEGSEGEDVVQASGYDATGPQLEGLTIPATGVAGQPLWFSVSPLDVWSTLAATNWSFGDDTTAIGTFVTHTYVAPGTYEVNISSTDALGSTTSAFRQIVIEQAATTKPSSPMIAPTLSAGRLTHSRFRVSRGRRRVSRRVHDQAPLGTSFQFFLSDAAKVTISIARIVPGQRRDRRCIARVPRHRHRHAVGCSTTLVVGTLTRSTESGGRDSVAFNGRIGRRVLTRGSYEAVLTASNEGGSSKPLTLKFTVVP